MDIDHKTMKRILSGLSTTRPCLLALGRDRFCTPPPGLPPAQPAQGAARGADGARARVKAAAGRAVALLILPGAVRAFEDRLDHGHA